FAVGVWIAIAASATHPAAIPTSTAAVCAQRWSWNKIALATSPAAIGTRIMFTIDSIILKVSIAIYCPASHDISNGVRNGAASVENNVIVTDSATFPLAR